MLFLWRMLRRSILGAESSSLETRKSSIYETLMLYSHKIFNFDLPRISTNGRKTGYDLVAWYENDFGLRREVHLRVSASVQAHASETTSEF